MNEKFRCVDLFCGCGGLSLGFHHGNGELPFETVMGLDIHPPALKCYNHNLSSGEALLETGRLCDLTWFQDPSEVLLYYLVHFAVTKEDHTLRAELNGPDCRFGSFLSAISHVDKQYEEQLKALNEDADYTQAVGEVDRSVFKLALAKRFTESLSIKGLGPSQVLHHRCFWHEETEKLTDLWPAEGKLFEASEQPSIRELLEEKWNSEVSRIRTTATGQGRGQHCVNADRAASLTAFLDSENGQKLMEVWLSWRGKRDALRLAFTTSSYDQLRTLYKQDREVHLLLGGPPCKGWSRIGRSAIKTLRDQGVSIWSNPEFGDERNALLYKYVLFVEALQPDVFLFENVSNFRSTLATSNGKLDAPEMLSEAIDSLSESAMHYEVGAKVVRMKHHAIPQNRDRFIMLGVNSGRVPAVAVGRFFKLPFEETEVPIVVSLAGLGEPGVFRTRDGNRDTDTAYRADAYSLIDDSMPPANLKYLKWIRQADPRTGSPPVSVDAHIVRQARADDAAFIEMLAPGKRWMDYKLKRSRTVDDLRRCLGMLESHLEENPDETLPDRDEVSDLLSRCDEGLMLRLMLEDTEGDLGFGQQHLLMDCYMGRGGTSHGDWLERLNPDRPCKTIIAHIGKDTYGYIHPFRNRALSIREAARVQSFPDWFEFGGLGVVESYSMIGESVPPLAAHLFALQLQRIHTESGLFGLPERADANPQSSRRHTQDSLFSDQARG